MLIVASGALCTPTLAQVSMDLGSGFGVATAPAGPARAASAPPGGQYLAINGYQWDDSVSETAIGLRTPAPPQGNGGLAWLQYYDTRDPAFANAPSDVITHVEVAFGTRLAFPVAPVAGSTYEVYVYEDPNDDGVPNDLVLLAQQGDTLMAPDMDVIEPTPISPTTVQGQFVVACFMVHEMSTAPPTPGVGEYPAALDQSVNSGGRAWLAGAIPETTWNPAQPNGPYAVPLSELDALGLPGVWLLRAIGNGDRGAIRYCTAKQGLVCGVPSIRATGASVAGSPEGFIVSAGPARGCRSGILLYNTNPGNQPFQGGTLCLDTMGVRRAGSTNSGGTLNGCDGEFAIDMNAFAAGQWQVPDCAGGPSAFPSSTPAPYLSIPGTQVFCQYWGRDSQPTGSFLSDALRYVVGASPDLTRPEGFDLYLTSGGRVDLDLPAGFFAPGSDPFQGVVQLAGEPLQTAGPFEMGLTDTVVRRFDRIEFGRIPETVVVPIEIVALNLVSIQPIVVTSNGGGSPTPWDVHVGLGDTFDELPEHVGVMRIDRVAPTGGTFDSILPVRPILTFRSGHQMVEFDPGVIPMIGTNGGWTSSPGCPTQQIGKEQLPVGFCQGTQLSSSLLDVQLGPAQPNPSQPPPAFIDPGASIHPQVGSLGRGCVILGGAVVGEGAIIGPNAFVGNNASVGDFAVLGAGARMDTNAQLGKRSVLGDGSHATAGVAIGPDTRIGSNCFFDLGSNVGVGTLLGDGVRLDPFAHAGDRVECGQYVVLGQNVQVVNDVRIAANATVPPGTLLGEDVVICISGGGVATVVPLSQCLATGGAIQGHLPLENAFDVKPESDKKVFPIDKTALPAALSNLGADINAARVAPMSNGGQAPDYVKDTNDCDDFAERLEKALQAKGYDATFTIVWTVDKTREFWEVWKPRFTGGHCLTDVHSGGKTIWIEAQFTRTNAIGVDIDDDDDGQVEYATGSGYGATDGCLRVEVYPDRKAAEKEWGPLD
jgi:acetyltransferase-like isoleucine patch superfamily enzyme